ncbi:hypothetical protein DFS34DRAFT_215610 [Phlyctochytrium arcticum]|nr:hypothetical protein DFS34DRAFT_215610 [Phlyctochytrium arcticum]
MVVDMMQHTAENVLDPWSTVKTESIGHADRVSWTMKQLASVDSSVYVKPEAGLQAQGTNIELPTPAPPTMDEFICATPELAEEVKQKYTHILTNEFKGGANGKTHADEYMVCNCRYTPGQEITSQSCGDDANCINRELFIECMGDSCPAGQYCQNRRFQNRQYAPIEIFSTEKKGMGLRATAPISENTFVIEYCGEVISSTLFKKRIQEYDKQGVKHFYFMSLKANEFIDASRKGNMSRFMNHSCAPNCALHKWVVGSHWRIGIFTLRDLEEGEELSFDYKFERYGAQAQECFCGAPNCKGYIGATKADIAVDSEGEGDSDFGGDEDVSKRQSTARRRRAGDDDDYAEVLTKHDTGGLTSAEDVQIITRSLFRYAVKPRRVSRLLTKVENTLEISLQRRFIWGHGLSVLKMCLREYMDKNMIICLQILRILKSLPIASKNTAEKVEDCVTHLSQVPDLAVSTAAKELLESWANLQMVYKIPKKIPMPKSESEDPPDIKALESTADREGSKRSLEDTDSPSYRGSSDSPAPKRARSSERDGDGRFSEHGRPRSDRRGPYRPFYENSRSFGDHQPGSDRSDNWSRPGSGPSDNSSPARNFPRSRPRSPSQSHSPYHHSSHFSDSRTSSRDPHIPPPHPPETSHPLPVGWKATRTQDGAVYYYNVETRATQWDFPSIEPSKPAQPSILPGISDSAIQAVVEEAHAAGIPQKPRHTEKDKKPSHAGGASNEFPKKLKVEIGNFVVKQMSKFSIPSEKFKDLARAVTRALIDKEQRTIVNFQDVPPLTDNKKVKIKMYVKDYCKRNGFSPKLPGTT